MYLPNDLWLMIKDYIFHNILKHGKHLKKDIWINNYNKCLSTLNPLLIPRYGQRLVYYQNSNERFIKFYYYFPLKYDERHDFFYNCIKITEIQILPENYDSDNLTFDHKLRYDYYHKKGKPVLYQ
tara:strand:+ start:816 stop:1190 length:375 start_codon:yes stop_codon:yes gene_type:complete